jgi:hypothetical protein
MRLVIPAILAAAVGAGCRTLTYTTPDGTTVRYENRGFDTKIGKLRLVTPAGVIIELENYDSQTQALMLAREAISALRSIRP